MFSRHHRKARVLFGLSDVILTVLAFEAAYQSRQWLPLERVFFLTVPVKALLLGFSVLIWLLAGLWLKVYDRLEAGRAASPALSGVRAGSSRTRRTCRGAWRSGRRKTSPGSA